MATINVKAGRASETTTGVEHGIDVRFTITIGGAGIDGICLDGECTLLPHEDGRPGYGSWGEADMWVDGRTLASLRSVDAPRVYREALDAIEAACGPVAAVFAS